MGWTGSYGAACRGGLVVSEELGLLGPYEDTTLVVPGTRKHWCGALAPSKGNQMVISTDVGKMLYASGIVVE